MTFVAFVLPNRKRGFVPKMRLMFERARSLEPEARTTGRRRRINKFADGTESVTSFVLESSPTQSETSRAKSEMPQDSSTSSSSNSFEYEEPSTASSISATNSANKRGFVNKCMTRVKTFMGSKNGLQS